MAVATSRDERKTRCETENQAVVLAQSMVDVVIATISAVEVKQPLRVM
jgi:hypothetical protein